MKNNQCPWVSLPYATTMHTQGWQDTELGFTGEVKWDRKTGTQGKGSDGNQNLVIRLTLRSPEVNRHNYDQLTLNKDAKTIQGLPQGLNGKESTCNAGDVGDTGLIPGLGRSPGEANGNPLQYSGLGNPMDRGTWQATAHGVAKSWIRLSDSTQHALWKFTGEIIAFQLMVLGQMDIHMQNNEVGFLPYIILKN